MKKIVVLLSTYLLLYLIAPVHAQHIVAIDLLKNSSIVINGSTNLLNFSLYQNGDKLIRKAQIVKIIQLKDKVQLSENKLSVAVKKFSSNNEIALIGFLDLLKANQHPNVNVEFNYIESFAFEKDESITSKAYVSFTITGVSKQYMIPINATRSGDLYTISGNKSINIHDFGLEAPVRMMGLVKVSEWINIDFNLICNITLDKK